MFWNTKYSINLFELNYIDLIVVILTIQKIKELHFGTSPYGVDKFISCMIRMIQLCQFIDFVTSSNEAIDFIYLSILKSVVWKWNCSNYNCSRAPVIHFWASIFRQLRLYSELCCLSWSPIQSDGVHRMYSFQLL